jgi:N-acetylglutamate synthase-like GNAT family acetyltransferase
VQVTIERLPSNHFPLLKGLTEEPVPDPRFSRAVVAWENGQIVAKAFLVAVIHVEGVWVREDKRGTPLFNRLVEAVYKEARGLGLSRLFAFGMFASMEDYLMRLNFNRLNWSVWNREV